VPPQNGKTVPARCKLCGASKDFPAVPKEIRPDAYEAKAVKLARDREDRVELEREAKE
jgi:hypothetical protein